MATCYCGSGWPFQDCCQPYILGKVNAPTSEILMRSRYSAYAVHNADYLYATTHPKQRKHHSKAAILEWAKSNQWLKLEIVFASETIVEFKAFYLDERLTAHVHHERSSFSQIDDIWFYVDGEY